MKILGIIERSKKKERHLSLIDQVLNDYATIKTQEDLEDNIKRLKADLDLLNKDTSALECSVKQAEKVLSKANGRIKKTNYAMARQLFDSASSRLKSMKIKQGKLISAVKELEELLSKIHNLKDIESSLNAVENFRNRSSLDLEFEDVSSSYVDLQNATKRASYTLEAYLELKSS